MTRLLPLLFFLFCFSSCSESLDGICAEKTHETINGFNVQWRKQITPHQKEVIRSILGNMVFVEGGYFTMGATPEQVEYARKNEYPNIYIKLSDYYINRYEVSVEEFNVITGSNISSSEKFPGSISLNEWRNFISSLKDLCSINFSLPTEAQWEYAARGGKYTQNYIYPGSNILEKVRSISPLSGSQIPNELGIYNMADLKSEWCEDLYDTFSENGLEIDRLNLNGKYHVVRGGNYLCNKESEDYYPKNSSSLSYRLGHGQKISDREIDYRHCRISSRSYEYDHIARNYIGCRLVINLNRISE